MGLGQPITRMQVINQITQISGFELNIRIRDLMVDKWAVLNGTRGYTEPPPRYIYNDTIIGNKYHFFGAHLASSHKIPKHFRDQLHVPKLQSLYQGARKRLRYL